MKKYKIQLEWRGTAENEKGIVSAIDNSVIARSEATRQSLDNSSLSNLEFEICNLQLGDVVISIDPNYYTCFPHT